MLNYYIRKLQLKNRKNKFFSYDIRRNQVIDKMKKPFILFAE